MNHIRKCEDCPATPPTFCAVIFTDPYTGREHGKLVCPSCAERYPKHSALTVEQIIALKHRIKEGADLDNPQTWARDIVLQNPPEMQHNEVCAASVQHKENA